MALKDLNLEELVDHMILRMKEEFPTKEELNEKIKHLPTKEEFYASEDKVMGELKDLRIAKLEEVVYKQS